MKNVYEDIASMVLPTRALSGEQQKKIVGRALEQIGGEKKQSTAHRRAWFKTWRVAAAAAALCCLGALGATAAGYYLRPSQVAQHLQQEGLAALFAESGEDKIQQTQQAGNFSVTLMGLASGENVTEYWSSDWGSGVPAPDRHYAVLAVAHLDGTPMAELTDEKNDVTVSNSLVSPVFASPECSLAEYNVFTMNGARHDLVQEGIHYILIETDTLEPFADKNPQLAVVLNHDGGIGALLGGFEQDPDSGEISVMPDTEGDCLLFDLPIDESKADPERAARLTKQWLGEESPQTQTEEAVDAVMSDGLASMTPEEIRAEGVLQEREVSSVTTGALGKGWYFQNGGYVAYQDGWNQEKEDILWASSSDGQMVLLTHNSDDTVTVETWIVPKQ